MNNELNEKKVGLLSRLIAKLHPAKISQKLTALALTTAIIFTLSSCNELPPTTGGSGTNPDSSQTDTNNPSQDENDYSQYSELLQYVLEDEYYTYLAQNMPRGTTATGKYAPHPYGFLEDEGYDISAIKSGKVDCYTTSYVLDNEPNNLYIFTMVSNKENNINTNYLLKYNLTDQEMQDYNMLHTGNLSTAYYFQSVFMNDAISQIKTPTTIQKFNIKTNVYDTLIENMKYTNYLDEKKCSFILYNLDQPDYYFDMVVIPKINEKFKMTQPSKIAIVSGKVDEKTQNGIYIGPSSHVAIHSSTVSNLNVLIYSSQNSVLDYTQAKSILKK